MAKKRIYFWTKMETDMWHDRRIKRLRRADHGADYILIYLMLTTETANADFTYTYEGLDDDIETEIAMAIDADENTVRDAIEWFVRLGMAEISEDRQTLTLYADRVGISVGSETNFARAKRDQRKGQDNAGDNVHQRGDNVSPEEDNVSPAGDNVRTEGRHCPTEIDIEKSKIKSKIDNKKSSNKKSSADDDLPFPLPDDTDDAPDESVIQGIKIVADAWNRMVTQVKADGVVVASVQASAIVPGKKRYELLVPILEKYGAQVTARCFDAYPQTDWWMGRGKDPRYEGQAFTFERMLRYWDEHIIPRADALQLIKQVLGDDGEWHYVVVDTQPPITETQATPQTQPQTRDPMAFRFGNTF